MYKELLQMMDYTDVKVFLARGPKFFPLHLHLWVRKKRYYTWDALEKNFF